MSDENEVAACPECDHAPVTVVSTDGMGGPAETKGQYQCNDCGARFDVPEYREPKRERNTTSGTAKRLLDADPEDWP